MQNFLFICFFSFGCVSSVEAQPNIIVSSDSKGRQQNFISKTQLKVGLNFPLGFQPFVSAEIKLVNRLTLNLFLGGSIDTRFAKWDIVDPAELADSDKIGISGFVSSEVRYYFFISNKNYKSKVIYQGFSGLYISIKHFASAPSTKINSAATFSNENVNSWQFHIGGQFQFKKHVFYGFNGGKVLSKHPINIHLPYVLPNLQFAVTLGYAF